MGMMAGTSDSPTISGAPLGLCQMATRRPARQSRMASVLAAGPPPKMATVFIFLCEWQLQLMVLGQRRDGLIMAGTGQRHFQACFRPARISLASRRGWLYVNPSSES